MQPTKSLETGHGARRAWQPPTVTKLAIVTQTKTTRGGAEPPPPQPPAAPATKLGFSFEMSLPLSSRTGGG